jgi:hypothetical protein
MEDSVEEKKPFLLYIEGIVSLSAKVVVWLLLLGITVFLRQCSGGDRGAIPFSQWDMLTIVSFAVSGVLLLILTCSIIYSVRRAVYCMRSRKNTKQ